MLFENGRVADAVAPYQRAVQLAPERAAAQYRAGAGSARNQRSEISRSCEKRAERGAARRERQSRCLALAGHRLRPHRAISAWRLWRSPSRTWRKAITDRRSGKRSAPSNYCRPDRSANALRISWPKPSANSSKRKIINSARIERQHDPRSFTLRRPGARCIVVVALPSQTSAADPRRPRRRPACRKTGPASIKRSTIT